MTCFLGTLDILCWDSDPDFLACFIPCFLVFRVFETPLSKARQNIVPNLHAMCWSLEIQVSPETHWWDYCISLRHTPELVLFYPYLHPDLCLEKKLQKGTGHVNLMIVFGTTDSSLDYSKTKGRDIMSAPPTQFFSIPGNTGPSSFSNTMCPQLTEEGLSLSFLQRQGVYWVHMARFW